MKLGRFFESATTNKLCVNRLISREVKHEILSDYTINFEKIGKLIIREMEQKTNFGFRNVEDFETYINAIDVDYDSEDVFVIGCLYKLNIPQLNMVKRSQYGRSTDFKQHFVENIRNKCYIPTSGHCFIKCTNHQTDESYTEEILTFIRNKQRRSNVMTSVRIQPFREKHNSNMGCLDGF